MFDQLQEKIQQNKTNKTWQQSRPNDVNSRSVRFSFFFFCGVGGIRASPFMRNMANWLCYHDYWPGEMRISINSGGAFPSLRSSPRSLWEHDRAVVRMSGSLGVGVQLRPPPLFIYRRLPIPPPGPSLAGSVFLNRESSDSPLRFQNRPRTGAGRQLTLKALFSWVFQLPTRSHAMHYLTAGFRLCDKPL